MRWAILLVFLLAPMGAQAQQPQLEACRPPVLAVQQPAGPFLPGDSTNLLMSVENPNRDPVKDVFATVTTTAPAGWSVVAAPKEMTLGSRNVSINTLAIAAPSRASGQGAGNVTVVVTFVCTNGNVQTTARATETLEVSIRAFQAPWPLVLGAFGVLAAGVTILGLRRLRRGVALTSSGATREIAPGKGTKFTFEVENRRGRPQRFKLVPEGVPTGWSLHLALDEVELEPGEEKTLWAILKAPPHAPVGMDVTITLHLQGNVREAAQTLLHARVIGL